MLFPDIGAELESEFFITSRQKTHLLEQVTPWFYPAHALTTQTRQTLFRSITRRLCIMECASRASILPRNETTWAYKQRVCVGVAESRRWAVDERLVGEQRQP